MCRSLFSIAFLKSCIHVCCVRFYNKWMNEWYMSHCIRHMSYCINVLLPIIIANGTELIIGVNTNNWITMTSVYRHMNVQQLPGIIYVQLAFSRNWQVDIAYRTKWQHCQNKFHLIGLWMFYCRSHWCKYTRWVRKKQQTTLYSLITFTKCWPIFKILSQSSASRDTIR